MGASVVNPSGSCLIKGCVVCPVLKIQTFSLWRMYYIQDYPDYYQLITHPIALSTLRKRISANYYKSISHFRDDWKLMFDNVRMHNQEGSWVYVDAEEMEKVLFGSTVALSAHLLKTLRSPG